MEERVGRATHSSAIQKGGLIVANIETIGKRSVLSSDGAYWLSKLSDSEQNER